MDNVESVIDKNIDESLIGDTVLQDLQIQCVKNKSSKKKKKHKKNLIDDVVTIDMIENENVDFVSEDTILNESNDAVINEEVEDESIIIREDINDDAIIKTKDNVSIIKQTEDNPVKKDNGVRIKKNCTINKPIGRTINKYNYPICASMKRNKSYSKSNIETSFKIRSASSIRF